jgi:hypothetical protein
MGNVANEPSAATGIQGFLERLYKPVYEWASGIFATKEEVAAIAGADLTFADDEDAEAIWDDYTFSTTD